LSMQKEVPPNYPSRSGFSITPFHL
jgi:hypothetical protein